MKSKRTLMFILIFLLIILIYLIYFGIKNNLLELNASKIENNILWKLQKIEIHSNEDISTINNIDLRLKRSNKSIKICFENNKCKNAKYTEKKEKINIEYDEISNFGGTPYTIKYKNNNLLLIKEADEKDNSKIIFYFEKKTKNDKAKYLTSYKEEKYNDKDEVIEEKENDNYLIKIENNNLILCQNVPEKCTTINYHKNGDEYLKTSDKDSPELSFIDAYDEEYGKIIKMTKKDNVSEDSYTVIYFKMN